MERETSLAGRISADDDFDAVMEQYGRLLRAAIARLCPRDMAAEYDDIHQEACLRLWRVLSSGRKIPSPASYVYRVAATTTIDAIRRVKARREETLEPQEPDAESSLEPRTAAHLGPDRAAEHRQLVEKTMRALADLPPHRRRAVGLYLQGLTTQEVADLSGWTEAKARNLVYRSLKNLRERLRAAGVDARA